MGGSSGLDSASRRTLRWFALKLAVTTGAATAAAVLAVSPGTRFLSAFQVLCFWASLLAAALALLGREVPRPGVLGFWDEALAFAALASLARIGARGLGP